MATTVVPQKLLGRLLLGWTSDGSAGRGSLALEVIRSNAPYQYSRGHAVECDEYVMGLAEVKRNIIGAKARKNGWTAKDARQLQAAQKLIESSLKKCNRKGK